ncbi:hypothetical protein DPMN_119741 [Dreissena polymorpha]|uniref:G-protein coupled receptors family 1 profile domain-containing protein n=2 Tax=Dreissena polymorpha TaxID=45954 RepID=A0A9D4GMX0_DREPO|nr:hypothetical protein DPMN_119741 [Dreissena polymorpha]
MAAHNSSLPSNETITPDHVALVQELNDKMARLMVPATVYISILMILGLVGNPMVFYYYGFKTKRTTNTFFLVILAFYDFIVCVVSMPTEIADIELSYTFENNVACKVLRFLTYFAEFGSMLTLVAIALDRFKKICRVTNPQIEIRTAQFISIGILGIAILLSWPALVLYGSIQVSIPNTYGIELMGADCTSTKDVAYKKYVWAFNGVHFLLFVVLSVVLIVLYSIIGHTIFSLKKKLRMYKPSKNRTPSSAEVKTSLSDLSQQADDKMKGNEKGVTKPQTATNTSKSLFASGNRHSTVSQTSSNAYKKSVIDNVAVKITLVMVVVSTVFIVSFLPYLSLTVWRVLKGKHEAEFLSDAGLVWFKIGTRSFLLNSSLNPWIYGLANSNFRKTFFGMLFKIW